jgi:hypothetical protein
MMHTSPKLQKSSGPLLPVRLTGHQLDALCMAHFEERQQAREFVDELIGQFRASVRRCPDPNLNRRLKRLLCDVSELSTDRRKRVSVVRRAADLLLQQQLVDALEKSNVDSASLDGFLSRTRKAIAAFEADPKELERCVFAAHDRLHSGPGRPTHGDSNRLIMGLCACWGLHSGQHLSGSRSQSNACLSFIKGASDLAAKDTGTTISEHTIYPILDKCVWLQTVLVATGLNIDELMQALKDQGIADVRTDHLPAEDDPQRDWLIHRDFVRFLHEEIRRRLKPTKGKMKPTTDFAIWLAENAPETVEDLLCLCRAVTDRTPMGRYHVSTKGKSIFVKTDDPMTAPLVIAKPAAERLFQMELYKLRSRIDPTSDPDMTMEGWYDYYRNQRKRDA